jgi:hypothetical protein
MTQRISSIFDLADFCVNDSSVMACSVEPVVDPEVDPAVDPEVEPAVVPEVDPVVDPEVEPAVVPEVVPVVEPEVDPAVVPEVEPVVEPSPAPPACSVSTTPVVPPLVLDPSPPFNDGVPGVTEGVSSTVAVVDGGLALSRRLEKNSAFSEHETAKSSDTRSGKDFMRVLL